VRVRKRKRKRTRAKKLDLTDIRHVLKDKRQWIAMGVVFKPEGESSHFELVVEDGVLVDILVDVETVPEGADVTARLGGAALSHGIITIPAEGDEVALMMPSGEMAFLPVIVALLSTNQLPNPTGEGPAEGRTLILNAEVLVHDGTGATDQLVKKTAYAAHKHPTGTGASGVPDNAAAASSYTDILKSK
jgi:hypothetical protein